MKANKRDSSKKKLKLNHTKLFCIHLRSLKLIINSLKTVDQSPCPLGDALKNQSMQFTGNDSKFF